MMFCTICGQRHDTSACPPMPLPMTPAEQTGGMTINGMTPFEHALILRLDKLISVLGHQQRKEE